jgi:MSHA biogenesis protein MshE
MGAPGYLIAAALQGIVAQRLVRRVCESCQEAVEMTPGQQVWLREQLGAEYPATAEFVRGRGCNYCYLTGYRGRIGIYELLEIDSTLTEKIRRQDLEGFLDAANAKESYVPLGRSAIDYALSGITSLDEAIRVAGGLDSDAGLLPAIASEDGADA